MKYQYQSAQNELREKLAIVETISNMNKLKIIELLKSLDDEKEIAQQRLEDNQKLKEDLRILEQKLKEIFNENQQYRDKVERLEQDLDVVQTTLQSTQSNSKKYEANTSTEVVTHDQMLCLEEELVLLKERFAQVSEEKLKLVKDLVSLREQYNLVCNRSHTKYFFYIAPLIIIVLYLLNSLMIS